jgi:hypothetical protein
MDSFSNLVAQWPNILRMLITIFGLIQSRTRITLTGLFLVAVSASALLYARKKHQLVDSGTVAVDGRKSGKQERGEQQVLRIVTGFEEAPEVLFAIFLGKGCDPLVATRE